MLGSWESQTLRPRVRPPVFKILPSSLRSYLNLCNFLLNLSKPHLLICKMLTVAFPVGWL